MHFMLKMLFGKHRFMLICIYLACVQFVLMNAFGIALLASDKLCDALLNGMGFSVDWVPALSKYAEFYRQRGRIDEWPCVFSINASAIIFHFAFLFACLAVWVHARVGMQKICSPINDRRAKLTVYGMMLFVAVPTIALWFASTTIEGPSLRADPRS